MKIESKYKDDARIIPDYKKMFKFIDKRGLRMSDVSVSIGKSSGYLGAMSAKNSKMLYGDIKKIARLLGLHGGTKLLPDEHTQNKIDNDILDEMKANMSTDERIAEALETIAGLLIQLTEKDKKERKI